jgi:purine-cytosine permease-like protein
MVILNIILLLGYSLLDCVVGGQVLSAVSPHGSMSVVVGIIIVAVITWVVTTLGIAVFHYYERFAFIPQLIVFCILYGVAAPHFDISTPSNRPDTRTLIGNRLSFFSICLSAAITYSGLAADFFVYWPTSTSRIGIFAGTLLGLTLSFTFALVLGVGLTSPLNSPNPYGPYSLAWTTSSGGSGSGSLMVAALSPLHNFGSFCSVLLALGLIANTIPPTYSSGIDFQFLGRPLQRIPRIVWNTIGVIIYTACALAGRNSLAVIFTNFLALLGYAFAIWFAILLSEFLFFRGASAANYDWRAWNDSLKLPLGIAALAAFLVGWAGAILCMAQVWYIGPLARLVGEYSADMGNYVGFSWAALVYPPLRWWEKRRFGR